METKNLLHVFLQTVQKQKKRPAFQYKKGSEWHNLSWEEALEEVREIALGLKSLGVKKGDMVAVFSTTRTEWTLCDLAILSLGAVTVPIYHSNTPDQAAFILQNSGTRFVFVENKHLLDKLEKEKDHLAFVEKIILITGKGLGEPYLMTLDQLQKKGREGDSEDWYRGIESIEPTSTATLVYTSGTTGPPKGAVLTHGNFLAELEACKRLFDVTDRDVSIVFLPLAHILARVMQFYHLSIGYTQAYAESIDKLVDNIGEVRPHFFVAVPRIFEKVHERVLQQVESGSALKKAIFAWATAIGGEISLKKQQKKMIGPLLQVKGSIASQLVFKKLKDRLGGRLRYSVSGGAPLSKDVAEFFHAAGILILEGYGLSETTAAINCNTLKHYRFGTVGPKAYGVEEKIAEDGEILVRGPVVFQGYYKDAEATRQVLSDDGWFKTGDIGEFDKDGFLKITDRKKDIIVTAGGKNIAPQNIENLLKSVPFISQAMVHGDRRKFLTALITLNRQPIEEYAQKEGITFANFGELVHHPKIYHMVKHAIDEKNKTLASYESIKRFAILPADFTQETGELTPTLKVKRKFVTEKYRDIVEGLYQE